MERGCSCNPPSPEALLLCVCMDWRKLCSATRSCGGGDVAAEGGGALESGGELLAVAGRGELFRFLVWVMGHVAGDLACTARTNWPDQKCYAAGTGPEGMRHEMETAAGPGSKFCN